MTPAQLRIAFEKMQKLGDLGRWMERLRGGTQTTDGEATREVMGAQTKLRALVKELQAAPEPYAGRRAAELGDAIEIAVSTTVEEGSESPLEACDRAEALLADITAHLEKS